jgi:hypothetical protein
MVGASRTAAEDKGSWSMGQEHLQGNQGEAEADVRSDDQKRGRPAEPLEAGKDDALQGEYCEPQTERDPDGGLRRDRAEGAQQERGKRRHRRPDDRALAASDARQLVERQTLVVDDAVGKPVRVNVREPEDDRGDGDQSGDVPRVIRKGRVPTTSTDSTMIVP